MYQKYDVVIAGAGAAGMMAALELGEAGKKVLLLEKGKSPAVSNFARAGGPAAAETEIQKKEQVSLTSRELYKHMSSWARHTVNEALLKNVVFCTGRAVNRMSRLGITMDLMEDTYGVGFRARHFFSIRGKVRTDIFVAELERLGVELWCDTEASELIWDEKGITGLIVRRTKDDCIEEISLQVSRVILCTGGFQGNPDMIRRFFGVNHMASLGNNLSSGDGIRMAEQAGAVLDRNFALPGNEGSATTTKRKKYNDNLCFGLYGGLLVDHNGLRFMNEKEIADFPLAIGGEAFARHEKTYCIVDSDMFEGCQTLGAYKYMGEPENWRAGKALWHPILEHAEEHLPTAIDEGWAFKGNSMEELAEYFHLPFLTETVRKYNEMCDKGQDQDFDKAKNFLKSVQKAPFYIFEYEPACWCTNGGIKTDSRLQALDANGAPIPGLYVIGADNGSMYTSPYYDNEGSSLGLALGSGVYVADVILS